MSSVSPCPRMADGSQRGPGAGRLCGTQRHTKKSCRISLPSPQSISRLTRLDSSMRRTIQPPSGTLQLANEYKHSTTRIGWEQPSFLHKAIGLRQPPKILFESGTAMMLKHIKVVVTAVFNPGLLWFNNHIFVVSDSNIKQFEASTGSSVSEWPVPDSAHLSCIVLPKHGAFIAYSTQRTVTFWDTATHTQLGLIQHPQYIRSIVLSPDDRFLAIGGEDGKITVNTLTHITVSIMSRCTGAYQQLSCSHHFSVGFNHFVSYTPYIPRTRHSHRRRCAPFLEAQSTCKSGSFIDGSVPESKSPYPR